MDFGNIIAGLTNQIENLSSGMQQHLADAGVPPEVTAHLTDMAKNLAAQEGMTPGAIGQKLASIAAEKGVPTSVVDGLMQIFNKQA